MRLAVIINIVVTNKEEVNTCFVDGKDGRFAYLIIVCVVDGNRYDVCSCIFLGNAFNAV